MASSTLIVNVVVTKNTRTVSQASFSIPAIFGPSNRFVDLFKIYNTAAAMLTDGFMTSDPEYIEALAMTSQAIKPKQFIVSKFQAAVAQVDHFTVNTLTAAHTYGFTINSVPISYLSTGLDTQQSILSALLAAIAVAFPTNSPVVGSVTGVGPAATLNLTSSVPGIGISYTAIDAELTDTLVFSNHSIVQDIQLCQAALLPAQQFYGLIVTSHVASDIEQIAAFAETQLIVYGTATADLAVANNVAGNLLSVLKAKSYDRTFVLYSAGANTQGPDGAWMGYMLPTIPGSSNWAEKTLVGITPDDLLTATQISNILGNNGNVYVTVAGNGTTLYGIACGGEFIDNTIFIDWLASTIQTNIIAIVTSPLNLKVPYTNPGISLIESGVTAAFKQGQDQGGLATGWYTFAPDVNDVSHADKSNRVLNNIGGNGVLAGAINQVNVQVFVSV